MFDTSVGAAQPDGILFDAFNDRVYVFSHPTRDATVIDAKDGTVIGTIDLGGVPEQGVADGKGNLWVVMARAQRYAHRRGGQGPLNEIVKGEGRCARSDSWRSGAAPKDGGVHLLADHKNRERTRY